MTRIISTLSYRRGTGKTTLVLSLAARLAEQGKRVGILDTDLIASGMIHYVGIPFDDIPGYFEEALADENQDVASLVVDVTQYAEIPVEKRIYALFSRSNSAISVADKTYDSLSASYGRVIKDFSKQFDLDYLLIDTYSGINNYSLMAAMLSERSLITFLLDRQHYQGTALLASLLHEADGETVLLAVNQHLVNREIVSLRAYVETHFGLDAAGFIPFSEHIVALTDGNALTIPSKLKHVRNALDELIKAF